jgi:dihydrofolate reductase
MDKNRLIGTETGLPWRLSADLRRFRKLTTGKPIVMGRKTLEQIGGPLKERTNIVLTRQADYSAPGCIVAHSIDEALMIANAALPGLGANEIMVIGGAEVYRQALPLVERIYLTIVEGEFTGNTWLPDVPAFRGEVIHEDAHAADEKNPHANRFLILERSDTGIELNELLQQ